MPPPPLSTSPCHPPETLLPPSPPLKRWRRSLRSLAYRLPDTGLLGLTPLRTHVVICGYPRSGTTLLQAMVEYAYPRARRFGREVSAWRAATYSWRNHAVLISKKPDDLLILHRLRNYYANRRARLCPIVMVRDPRDVLTSRHVTTGPTAYFEDAAAWRARHEYCSLYRQDPGVLTLRYEDLVADPAAVQHRVQLFTGEMPVRPFADFHTARLDGFDTRPLNGIRPVDRKTVGRWAAPEHAPRIAQILRDLPDLPDLLVQLGYEPDTRWTTKYPRQG